MHQKGIEPKVNEASNPYNFIQMCMTGIATETIRRVRSGSQAEKASIPAAAECVRADIFGVVSQHVI